MINYGKNPSSGNLADNLKFNSNPSYEPNQGIEVMSDWVKPENYDQNWIPGISLNCMVGQQFMSATMQPSYINYGANSYDPTKVMDQYCWCKFDYEEYGLSLEQIKLMNNIMIDKASEHMNVHGLDGCNSRDSVYLNLLKDYEYKVTTEKDAYTKGKIQAYKCLYNKCGKTFTRAWNLLNHARMHQGVKPFACQICHKSFTQRGNLKKHMMIHLLPKAEDRKRYKCDKCGKGYTEKYNYMVSLTLKIFQNIVL